jgi:hypothetical protein
MSAGNFRWVCTDRRDDAAILSEIAAGDTSLIILSGRDPAPWISALSPAPAPSGSLVLIEPCQPDDDGIVSATRLWPVPLSLLVTPPAAFGAIVLTSAPAPNPASDSLWDWLLSLAERGAEVSRRQLHNSVSPPRMGDIPLQLLRPGSSRLSPRLERHIRNLAGLPFPADEPDVLALQAGLFQWHDALDESHVCSQAVEGRGRHRAGDYWHAIMHRREPDYGNSKYWFRRVGSHPIFPELARRTEPIVASFAPDWQPRLLKRGWDPFAFVDLCEAVANGKFRAGNVAAEQIQQLEMLLLLEATFLDATAGSFPDTR